MKPLPIHYVGCLACPHWGPYFVGKDIEFRFITESSSFGDFGPLYKIGLFLYEAF
jgi:hypothetical protein